ncbi:hypothetical protein BKA57DRAFT_456277 [Linnemannia elongata]|nr:hypothetical protein BKA57DRAFT_456277 [Linnemannia elongata]
MVRSLNEHHSTNPLSLAIISDDNQLISLFFLHFIHSAKATTMATSKMRVTFRGAMKCYLIFCTIIDCSCPTCDVFTKCETIQFADSPGDTYGIIPLDQFDKTVIFDICWEHQMMMNLIPWADLECARARDLDLYVCGWKRNTKWLDTVVVGGKLCKISVEIFCPVQWAPVVYQQCFARQQHCYQQQQPYVYVQQHQQQVEKRHSRNMSAVAGSIAGEVVKETLFELTIDLGMAFFFGC